MNLHNYTINFFLYAIIWINGAHSALQAQSEFTWIYDDPAAQGMSTSRLQAMTEVLAAKGTKKLFIVKNDRVVWDWSAPGSADSLKLHYTASLAKALVGGMSLARTIHDGILHPDQAVCLEVSAWKKGPKQMITVRHLANHTSGLEDAEVTNEEAKQMQEAGLHHHMDLPGWKGMFWRKDPDPFTMARDSARVLFTPGTNYAYSNTGIAMLNYVVTVALRDRGSKPNIRDYLWTNLYSPMGIGRSEFRFGYGGSYQIDGLDIVPGWGGGSIGASASAKIGRLMLNKGNWEGSQLLDSSVVRQVLSYAETAVPERPMIGDITEPVPATTLGWYSNFDGVWKYVPRDAFAGAGAQHQLLLVVPSLDLIVTRFGDDLADEGLEEAFWYAVNKYLFEPVMEAVEVPPYERSPVIKEITFAPADEVIRMAPGGDNWPATWADDGSLYTAYGDGYGFKPHTGIKLSLGLSKVTGEPPHLKATNIRTASGERVGQGKFGEKASGMLMVDGVLYMLVRNAVHSSLAWSEDHGLTWQWSNWKFPQSFGAPTFLNFGKNYHGARDDYVYIYSHDDASAYEISDQMVMARVDKTHIRDKNSYEYFTGISESGPTWSEDVYKREPVFSNPGKCYRSSVTFNEGLDRYFWSQIIPTPYADAQGTRFLGGLAIYDAPEPWGPWTTAFYDLEWDMGPGETGSIPTKWMNDDGQTCHYLFSGEDAFSLRRFRIALY
ncbi:MAG: serine hydrolase [Saprospiraceae bacterium]|nr:serine hydrolase [Saprospiraceae bacterium]